MKKYRLFKTKKMTKEKRNLIIAAQAIYACVFWLMFMWVTDGKIIEPRKQPTA